MGNHTNGRRISVYLFSILNKCFWKYTVLFNNTNISDGVFVKQHFDFLLPPIFSKIVVCHGAGSMTWCLCSAAMMKVAPSDR